MWKPIKDYPGYEISDDGQVRSYWKAGGYKGLNRLMPEPQRILKPQLYGQSYCKHWHVLLYNERRRKLWKVHRLVLLHFGPEQPVDKPLALHKDDNRNNNHIDNLYWGDKSNNTLDSVKNGTFGDRKGENNGKSAKLTSEQVLEIRKSYPEVSASELGKKYGISSDHITRIIRRERWSHF